MKDGSISLTLFNGAVLKATLHPSFLPGTIHAIVQTGIVLAEIQHSASTRTFRLFD